MWLLTLTVLLSILAKIRNECPTPTGLKTRHFDSIVHYQSNKLPFNPRAPGWDGSYIAFNFTPIETLERNVFITYDSSHVIQLDLSQKQVKKIEPGAFTSLFCLQNLFLHRNNITELSRSTFQGLSSLEELDLSHNQIEKVQDLSFALLGKLKVLNLARNRIQKLQSLAFANLTSLENLDLEFNSILTMPNDLFESLANMKSLDLAFNRLGEVEPQKWLGLAGLRVLNLAGNGLDHFDPSYNFSFSLHLTSLNLTSNKLTKLNVVALSKHLPQLGFVDLENNQWLCDDLESIIKELRVASIRFLPEPYIRGESCSEDIAGFSLRTTSSAPTITTSKNPGIDSGYIKSIVEKKVEDSNAQVISAVAYLQKLVIFLFVVVFLFIFLEILLRSNCCWVLYRRFRGGNGIYYDNSDLENFRLLHR